MITKLDKIIETASDRFAHWVTTYRPWHGENHTTERNLSFQLATAFLDLHENGIAFMEVPFTIDTIETVSDKKIIKKRSNHLDAYLHAEDFDLLVECKNIYAPSHIDSIVKDIERMDQNLISQIHERYKKTKPVRTYGVVFAETWYPHVADWWVDNKNAGNKQSWQKEELKLPDGWKFKKLKVYDDKQDNRQPETLFWLYGVSEKELNQTLIRQSTNLII